jgi:methionyl-tRNA formyltransferase
MLTTKPYRTIALLGREPGIFVLKDALLNNPLINMIAVYTHGSLPKKEGGLQRPELANYVNICESADIPLHVLDIPEARQLASHLPTEAFDLLIVLSWRCILEKSILDRPKTAAINLHRGALPKYKGAEPVLRAINAGDRSISITAHHMTEELDEGPVIATVEMDILPCPANVNSEEYAEQIKRNLYPHYAPLVRLSIESLTQPAAKCVY